MSLCSQPVVIQMLTHPRHLDPDPPTIYPSPLANFEHSETIVDGALHTHDSATYIALCPERSYHHPTEACRISKLNAELTIESNLSHNLAVHQFKHDGLFGQCCPKCMENLILNGLDPSFCWIGLWSGFLLS